MTITQSHAQWQGTLKEGSGSMTLPQGGFEGPFTWATRFADDTTATNPEELIGAAHAGCYSMFLSALLGKAGYTPNSVRTTATVHLGDGPTIERIALACVADVPGIETAELDTLAAEAKANCPVSKALASVDEITLDVQLAPEAATAG